VKPEFKFTKAPHDKFEIRGKLTLGRLQSLFALRRPGSGTFKRKANGISPQVAGIRISTPVHAALIVLWVKLLPATKTAETRTSVAIWAPRMCHSEAYNAIPTQSESRANLNLSWRWHPTIDHIMAQGRLAILFRRRLDFGPRARA